MTKKKDPPNIQAMVAPYPGALAEPVVVNSDASDEEIRQAINACDAKLPALAEHYGVDLSETSGPLLLCLAMAKAHVPGFQIEMKRRTGAPKKPPGLDIAMSVLLEAARQKDGSRGFKHLLAKQLAEDEARAIAKNEGRQRPTREEIAQRTRSRENDLSRLDKEPSRLLARFILDGLNSGKSIEEIAKEAVYFAEKLSHENPPEE